MSSEVLPRTSKSGFSPTVLIVDDDSVVTRRWSREFLDWTSLGVVIANTLKEAADLIVNKTVNIDAIVADIYFGIGHDDTRGLGDGLSLLKWAHEEGVDVPFFVMSAEGDSVDHRSRISALGLPIVDVIDKFAQKREGDETVWSRIQREIIEQRLAEATSPAEKGGTVSAVNKALATMKIPVRTYLQEFPSSKEGGGGVLRVLTPIEIICVHQSDGTVNAFAPSIGLLGPARGETVREAVDTIAEMIEAEANTLILAGSGDLSEYAQLVVDNLKKFIDVGAK